MSFQSRKSFVCLQNTIEDILDENREACDCPIDCQVNYTVMVQKSMKSIATILPSVVQSECYEVQNVFTLLYQPGHSAVHSIFLSSEHVAFTSLLNTNFAKRGVGLNRQCVASGAGPLSVPTALGPPHSPHTPIAPGRPGGTHETALYSPPPPSPGGSP